MLFTDLQKHELKELLFNAASTITKTEYGEAVYHLTVDNVLEALSNLDYEAPPPPVPKPFPAFTSPVKRPETVTGQAPEPPKVSYCPECSEPLLPGAVHAPWCKS